MPRYCMEIWIFISIFTKIYVFTLIINHMYLLLGTYICIVEHVTYSDRSLKYRFITKPLLILRNCQLKLIDKWVLTWYPIQSNSLVLINYQIHSNYLHVSKSYVLLYENHVDDNTLEIRNWLLLLRVICTG